TDPTKAVSSFDFNSYGLGNYQLFISALDADNDRDDDALSNGAFVSVTVVDDDNSAPVITLTPATATQNDGQNQIFTWNVTDASNPLAVLVTITKNGNPLTSFTSTSGNYDFNGDGLGVFKMTVTATDNDVDWVGDQMSANDSRTVTV